MVKIAFNSALAQKALGKDATAAEKVSEPVCRFFIFSLVAGLHRPPTLLALDSPCTFARGLFACCVMLIIILQHLMGCIVFAQCTQKVIDHLK